MSTVKISELPNLPEISANTSNTLFMGVDIPTLTTGKFTATTLAQQLFANNELIVGENRILFSNTIAQFSGVDEDFMQINIQNFDANGSTDLVLTADTGTNSNSYVDLGINNSDFNPVGNEQTSQRPYDGYLVVQGPGTDAVGNLIVGTAETNTALTIVVGGLMSSNITAKFNSTNFTSYKPIIFADGSSQNTAVQNTYVASIDSYVRNANTWLQANDTLTLTSAKSYTDTANTFLRSNDSITLASSKSYTDTANTFLRANDTITLTAAKSYTDTANSYVKTYTDNANTFLQSNDAITLASAKSYTDLTINAGAPYAKANDAWDLANTAYHVANTAYGVTVVHAVEIGALTSQVLSTGIVANNALANTTGTFGGDLNITGNTQALSMATGNLMVSGTSNIQGQLDVVATVSVTNTSFLSTQSALKVSGTTTVSTPANDGYMIHVSGKDGVASRVVNDSHGNGAYALFAGRASRGTADSPTAIQSGDVIARYSASGFGSTKYQALGTGRIDFVAAENFTDTSTGTQIRFYNCPVGSNTVTNIATFNGTSAVFSGNVNPEKGFVYTPRVISGNTSSIVIDFASDCVVKATCNNICSVSFTNYVPGKVVELWITNLDGSQHALTHGCTETNATNNSTTKTIPATSSIYLKYFSIDSDLANTFVSITQG